jgi:hypothetical protein
MHRFIILCFIFFSVCINGYSQSNKFDCKILSFVLNDIEVKKQFRSIKKHKELPLIINDFHHYFDECLQFDDFGRKATYTYDSFVYDKVCRDKNLKVPIYLGSLTLINDNFNISVFDPSTGTIIEILFILQAA